ncbi:MAG: DUF4437 domain-containing protein, partial [Bacteroidota bacterium]
EKMWMPAGSYWTQPAGEAHITAAQGEENIAYVEIESGPYLVKPTEEAYDNGERPINVDVSNMVWLDASETTLIDNSRASNMTEIGVLWKEEELSGFLIKIPENLEVDISTEGTIFDAVVIAGRPKYDIDEEAELDPGSSFSSDGHVIHRLYSPPDGESLLYVRTDSDFKISLAER